MFRRLFPLLALVGVVLAVMLVVRQGEDNETPPAQGVEEPARAPFPDTIGGSGLVEAVRENVRVAAPQAGLVTDVFVEVGQEVTSGTPLFQLDRREAEADVRTQQAQIPVLIARLRESVATYGTRRDQYERTVPLVKQRVLSQSEGERVRFSLHEAAAQVERAKAELESAVRNLEKSSTTLEVLTVRAPRNGTVLQVNVRAGEYASGQSDEPLLLLGETNSLQVRADIDEQNASRVRAGAPAVAYVKGVTDHPIPLRFIRIDPYILPKRSLTGLSTERVDTRVLQVIYGFDQPADMPVYVGQQVDVFIDASPDTQETRNTTATVSTGRLPKEK